MNPARLHLVLGVSHLAAAARTRDGLVRGLLGLLGVRYLGQAAVLRRPTPRRRRASVAVDVAHGLTAVAWAVRGPRDRHLGALSAGLSAIAVAVERPADLSPATGSAATVRARGRPRPRRP